MSLLWVDSFDQVKLFPMKTLPSEDFASVRIEAGAGLDGAALFFNDSDGHYEVPLANEQTIIMGGYFRFGESSDLSDRDRFEIFALYDENDDAVQFRLAFEPSGRNFQVFRGTTFIASSAASIDLVNEIWRADSWVFIEFKITIDNTVGAYEARLNGKTILSDSGVDTQQTTHAYATLAVIGNVYTNTENMRYYVDSFYVCNGDGAINNDFLGPIRVEYLPPSAQGLYDYWQEYEVGSALLAVDETGDPDDDNTFIASPHANSPLGNKAVGDIHTFKNSGGIDVASATVHGIAMNAVARATRARDDSARTLAAYTGHKKTYSQGTAASIGARDPATLSTQNLSPTTGQKRYNDIVTLFYGYQWIEETNVRTGAAWSVSDVPEIDFGVRLVS